MPAAMELRSAQIVVEDRKAKLRLNIDGRSCDYELREAQVLLLCRQGIEALCDLRAGP